MAGLGRKVFNAGDVLTAAQVQGYLQDQAVMVFGGTAARASAIPTPSEGMISYRTDDNAIEFYDGTSWAPETTPFPNAQAGTAYTFVATDAGKLVSSNNASAVTFTIPPQSSVAWPANTVLTVMNYGAGALSIAGGAGVTVTNSSATVAQYSSATVVRTGSDAWTVVPAGGSSAGLTLIAQNTFTSVSTVTIDNVFTSTYDNYRFVVSATGSSNANGINFYFINSTGSNVTSGYYSQVTSVPYADNSTTLSALYGNSQVPLAWLTNGTTTLSAASVDIFRPNLASETIVHGNHTGINAGSGYQGGFLNSMYVSDTQMRGIYLFNGAGTNMTGRYWVYGYKNS